MSKTYGGITACANILMLLICVSYWHCYWTKSWNQHSTGILQIFTEKNTNTEFATNFDDDDG